MQIQITPTPKPLQAGEKPNTILFCQVDCYENHKTKNAEGKSITVQVKVASLDMVMGDEETTLVRIQRKFPKCKPILIKAIILKSWNK